MSFELPRIKIEVERMRYAIVHQFSAHNDEIEKAVNDALEKAIGNYPFDQEIEKITNEVIDDAIRHELKDYFMYGEGRKVLQEEISKVMSSLGKT